MAIKTKLTKRLVEAIPTASADTIAWDTELKGFGCKVTPSGRRSYFVYYRMPSGQQRRPTIGVHGQITVDEARQIARGWLVDAARGKDTSAERQAGRQAPTIADLAERYLSEYAALHKKPRSIATDRSNIENHVLPLLGSRKVADVTRADIDRVKLAVRDGRTARRLEARPRGRRVIKGGEGIANRVVALLSKMLACAEEWELRTDNPARGIRKFREHRKDRFLSAEEIGRLLAALERASIEQTEKLAAISAIRLLLFTGMRLGEALNLRWRNYDRATNCLRIADSKTGARVVPLSQPAAAALQGLPISADPEKLIFEGHFADRPLSLTKPWYRVRSAAGIDSTANLHALRHTFASWSVMGGLSLAQVGALLGHRSTQTTLRYADHMIDAMRSYSEQTGAAIQGMRAD